MVTQSQNIAKDAEFYGRGFVYIVTYLDFDIKTCESVVVILAKYLGAYYFPVPVSSGIFSRGHAPLDK